MSRKKFNYELFISTAKQIHTNKNYTFDHVNFIDMYTKVLVTCPIHGDFSVQPRALIYGKRGCRNCRSDNNRKMSEEKRLRSAKNFIDICIKVHQSKYNYDETIYVNERTKVLIICPCHGPFWQLPRDHMLGRGCRDCGDDENRRSAEEFILLANKIHNKKYNYDKVVYVNCYTKVLITCPIHGDFEQQPQIHLRSGCKKCASESQRKNTEQFINEAMIIHKGFYTYNHTKYLTCRKQVIITCPIHGDFKQLPGDHLAGSICLLCHYDSLKYNTETFIKKAIRVHGNDYAYDLVNYTNCYEPIIIKCPKHGLFEQIPVYHLSGHGCPVCHESKGEKEIRRFLTENKIKFIPQKRFDNCRNKNPLPFDFAVYENDCLKFLIEYQGQQHFISNDVWGGKIQLEYIQHNDTIKKEYCLRNNIPLLLITYKEFKYIHQYISKFL